jgi:hypothetical protein
MTRSRTWLVVLAALAVLVSAMLVALPAGVRLLAERRVEALTGRVVTIEDVDLNLFTRRLAATGIRVHGVDGARAPVALQLLDTRFQLLPLLRGGVHLERLALSGLDVYLQRTAPDRLNISDVLARLAARPESERMRAIVETLVVSGGQITLEDQAVEPRRGWTLGDLALEAHDIVTTTDTAQGRASATFMLAGGPGLLEAERVGLRPPQARMRLMLDGVDLSGLGAYFPGETVRLAGGRLSTRLALDYDATGSVRAGGEISVRDLSFTRRGQDPPLLAVPAIAITARDLVYEGGQVGRGHLDIVADRLTVHDATAPQPRPLDVTALRATWQARATGPGQVTVEAELPQDGRLLVTGTAQPLDLAADLDVEVTDLAVALVDAWLPAASALTPMGGRLAAALSVRYAPAAGLATDGKLRMTGLEVARVGQDAPFLRDEHVVATVRGLSVRGGVLRLGRVEVVGSPTLVDASITPPQRVHLPRVALIAEDAAVPGDRPARVRVNATLPRGGRLEAHGTAGTTPLSASLDISAHDADLALAAPYVSARAPITLDRGRLDARLALVWDGALHAGGRVVARDLTLLRGDQAEPFIHHPSLEATVTGLLLRDGELSIERVAIEGAPTIVDTTAASPQHFDVQALMLAIGDFTWPGRRPARLEGRISVADGGVGELTGTIHPTTLATDVRVRLEDVDVARADAYLPSAAPLEIRDGRGEVTVTLRHRRADGVRLDAEGVLHGVALALELARPIDLRDERVSFSVDGLVLGDGVASLEAAAIDATPALAPAGEAASPTRLHARVAELRWPSGPDARWQVVLEPAGGGSVTAQGTLAPAARALTGTLEAEDAALAAFSALLPVAAPLAGRLDASLHGTAGGDGPPTLTGDVTLREVTLGPPDTPPIRIAAVTAPGLTLRGPELTIPRLAVERPSLLVERRKDGTFPLRAMLTPAPPAAAPGEERPDRELQFTVEELAVREGTVRFVDHRTMPAFYSEELTRLALTVRGLTTIGDRRAELALQGIVGVDAALDLEGEVAPFATPFFLDVAGELREFSIARTNPYLQRFLDWTVQRGELATEVHYRIEGDHLTATNRVVVQRLDVDRAGDDDRSKRLVGLPLGLVVALLKDARGNIDVTLPISGELGSPDFSFGGAIRTALRNVLSRLVSAPFRAIGSVFRREGTVQDVAIAPVAFPEGGAGLSPDAAAHLQRVADFLRASPYVWLALEPVISDEDLRALRVQQVTARIQALQRQAGLDDFAEAARRLWQTESGGEPVPPDPQAIVRELAQRAPVPPEAARQLAERRLEATRGYLVDTAGIQPERLLDAAGSPPLGGTADGSVEFELRPAS